MSPSRDARQQSPEGWEALWARAGEAIRSALRGSRRLLAGRRLEVATAIALLGGGLLIVGEFLDVYRVQRGVVVIQEQTGGDNHSYALLIAGAGAIAATLVARSTGAWPPAAAAAALGLAALAVAFLGDLPDATSSGLTSDARLAEAEPAAGFWVEVAGGVATLAGGAALALLLRSGPAREGE